MENIPQNTEKVNRLYGKMLSIMESVQYMGKDTSVQFGKTNYAALSEEKVTTIMREQMVKQKLIVFPVEMYSHREGQISHVDVKYRIVDTESGEYIEVVSCGDGADTQDKGAGKAMTYAYKYMWLRTFAIPTGEDPDQISSEQLDAEQKKAKANKELKSDEDPLDKLITCDICGDVIKPFKDTSGKVTSPKEWKKKSEEALGRCVCNKCIKEGRHIGE